MTLVPWRREGCSRVRLVLLQHLFYLTPKKGLFPPVYSSLLLNFCSIYTFKALQGAAPTL